MCAHAYAKNIFCRYLGTQKNLIDLLQSSPPLQARAQDLRSGHHAVAAGEFLVADDGDILRHIQQQVQQLLVAEVSPFLAPRSPTAPRGGGVLPSNAAIIPSSPPNSAIPTPSTGEAAIRQVPMQACKGDNFLGGGAELPPFESFPRGTFPPQTFWPNSEKWRPV